MGGTELSQMQTDDEDGVMKPRFLDWSMDSPIGGFHSMCESQLYCSLIFL